MSFGQRGWVRGRKGSARGSQAGRGNRRRLRLESLEQRLALAAFVVNGTGDVDDGDANNNSTTLREAVNRANNTAGADQISFNLPNPATIHLSRGELLVTDAVTIAGPGAGSLTIDASANDPTPTQNNGDGTRLFHFDNRVPLTRPGDTIVATSNNSPGSEGVANAIDNRHSTKYLNFDRLNTGFTVTPAIGTTIVRGLQLTSANDAPERDPASFTLEGSNDGTNFTQISSDSVPAFPQRFYTHTIDISNNTIYRTYRLIFPTVVGPGGNSMQIAEVEFLGQQVNRVELTAPGDPIVATSNNSPGNEGVTNAIDNSPVKYLNFDRVNTGFTVTPSVGPSIVQAITLQSANDSPDRDPADYILSGSNDGTNFTQIRAGGIPAFPARFFTHEIVFSNTTAWRHYRLIFPNTFGNSSCCMQIAEVELFGHVGSSLPAAPQYAAEVSGLTLTGGDINGFGGAVFNRQTLTITGSTISGNSADFDGGGVYHDSGTLTITSSTITGNTAGLEGGGIKLQDGVARIVNSTISGNTAANGGGGIQNAFAELNIDSSTITNNTDNATSPRRSAGGIWMFDGSLQLQNSIVAGNHSTLGLDINRQISTQLVSLGHNLIGRGAGGVKTAWTTGAGANGHVYEVVRVPAGIHWNNASAAARAAGGHLATITSAAENAFVFSLIDQAQFWSSTDTRIGPWLGGLQPVGSVEPAGGWSWVTGETFGFANWFTTQPDNAGNAEDRLHFFSGGAGARTSQWNDIPAASTLPIAYVIEYGALPYHPSDLVGVDPRLGPLTNNGGPTRTHALLTGSPAINAIATGTPDLPTTDQRGFSRPFGSGFDIGSFESGHPNCNDGDLNADGVINRTDVALLALNFGRSPATCAQGNVNATGPVNLADLAIMQSHLFATLPSPPAPSPTAPSSAASPTATDDASAATVFTISAPRQAARRDTTLTARRQTGEEARRQHEPAAHATDAALTTMVRVSTLRARRRVNA